MSRLSRHGPKVVRANTKPFYMITKLHLARLTFERKRPLIQVSGRAKEATNEAAHEDRSGTYYCVSPSPDTYNRLINEESATPRVNNSTLTIEHQFLYRRSVCRLLKAAR